MATRLEMTENNNKLTLSDKTECPYGDTEIDYVSLGHREYIFCYVCQSKYFKEDYSKMGEKLTGEKA